MKAFRFCAAGTLLLGMALRFWSGDAWPGFRTVYYALPWPVLAAGWLGASFLHDPRRWQASVCLIISLVCGSFWVGESYRAPEPRPLTARTLKVLSWNMAHEKLPSDDLQTLLDGHKPDIAGLVEVGLRHGDPNPLVANLPAGYTVKRLDHGMALIARGSIRVVDEVKLPSSSKFAILEVTVDAALWRVFVVDGASRPTTSREDVMTRLLAETQGQPRAVLVGDFNTPIESRLFEPWRGHLKHAFDEAGSGFRETWPKYVPVLTIDHVWSSSDSPALKAQKQWLPSSDHAALLVELEKS